MIRAIYSLVLLSLLITTIMSAKKIRREKVIAVALGNNQATAKNSYARSNIDSQVRSLSIDHDLFKSPEDLFSKFTFLNR